MTKRDSLPLLLCMYPFPPVGCLRVQQCHASYDSSHHRLHSLSSFVCRSSLEISPYAENTWPQKHTEEAKSRCRNAGIPSARFLLDRKSGSCRTGEAEPTPSSDLPLPNWRFLLRVGIQGAGASEKIVANLHDRHDRSYDGSRPIMTGSRRLRMRHEQL